MIVMISWISWMSRVLCCALLLPLFANAKFGNRRIVIEMIEDQADQADSYKLIREDPPPVDQVALMARYIVNQADWTSAATISSRDDIASFPTVNVLSHSDGPLGNGAGIPYLYLTPLDYTAKDVAKDHRATLMMSLAQVDYCKREGFDPMDPRCARVLLTGKIKEIMNTTTEFDVARRAVFGRHPWLENMPADHHFFFAKLEMFAIAVLDTFGGPKYVAINDYLHPPTPNVTEEFLKNYKGIIFQRHNNLIMN